MLNLSQYDLTCYVTRKLLSLEESFLRVRPGTGGIQGPHARLDRNFHRASLDLVSCVRKHARGMVSSWYRMFRITKMEMISAPR